MVLPDIQDVLMNLTQVDFVIISNKLLDLFSQRLATINGILIQFSQHFNSQEISHGEPIDNKSFNKVLPLHVKSLDHELI